MQGEVTEKGYFERLRSALRIAHVSIQAEPQSPERIVHKAKRHISNDKNAPFSKIFFVVDKDDSSVAQFQQGFNQASKIAKRDTDCRFVVSNECFEVWLLAHLENVKGRNLPRGVLAEKLIQHGAVEASNPKQLSKSFPILEFDKATQNCGACGFDEVGEAGTSAMHLLMDLLGQNKGTPSG